MFHEIIIALVTVLALAITIISARSYRRSGNKKVLLVTITFAFFFVKGLVLSYGVLTGEMDFSTLLLYSSLLDLFILMSLFASIIIRK
ncbi:MAG: hypothetical protein V3U51_04420 [Thermoplasmata archaeon]